MCWVWVWVFSFCLCENFNTAVTGRDKNLTKHCRTAIINLALKGCL